MSRNLSQECLWHAGASKLSCSCISWNPSSSHDHSPMTATGSDDSSPNTMAKVQIPEYSENTSKYATMETLLTVTDPVCEIALIANLGRSFHILVWAVNNMRIVRLMPVREKTSSGEPLLPPQIWNPYNDSVGWSQFSGEWVGLYQKLLLAPSGDDGWLCDTVGSCMDNWDVLVFGKAMGAQPIGVVRGEM